MSEKLSNFRGVGKTVRGRLKAAIQNLFSYLKKLASIRIVWISQLKNNSLSTFSVLNIL